MLVMDGPDTRLAPPSVRFSPAGFRWGSQAHRDPLVFAFGVDDPRARHLSEVSAVCCPNAPTVAMSIVRLDVRSIASNVLMYLGDLATFSFRTDSKMILRRV